MCKKIRCHAILHLIVFSRIVGSYFRSFYCSRVIPAFLAIEEASSDVYMMEAILTGRFTKYMGNKGNDRNTRGRNAAVVCMALAHWSVIFSHGDFMITDFQGTMNE